MHYFGIAEPTAVATSPQNLAKVLQALDLAPKSFPKPQIVILEDGTPGSSSAGLNSVSPCPVTQMPFAKVQKFPSDFLRSDLPPLPPLDLSTSDTRQVPAAMCFSSGTSGKPKGVLLSHYGLINHMMCPRATDPALYNGFHREVFFPPCMKSRIFDIRFEVTPFQFHISTASLPPCLLAPTWVAILLP